MAAQMITPITSFNANSDMGYTKARVNSNGGKSVGIIHNDTKKQLHVSVPLMLTWGVNVREDESTGRVSYDLSLQFPRPDDQTAKDKEVLSAFQEMEDQIMKAAVANSKEWFNKAKLTEGQVDVLFNRMLYYPKHREGPNVGEVDESKGPTLRVKLDCWDGKFKSEIYDMDSQPLYPNDSEVTPVELITKGCNIASILKSGGIYFIAGKFGTTWRLHQAVVKPRESLKGRCLIQLDAGERAKLEAQVDNEDDEGESVAVVDSDEEDDESETSSAPVSSRSVKEEAKVEVEEEVKPKKKRVVRRKKKSEEEA